jgi:hypothetical protein
MTFNEVETRIIKSLTSDLEAFIFHEELIDPKKVTSFLKRNSLGDILVLKSLGKGIHVLLFNEHRIESECLYRECSNLRSKERDVCVAKCKRKEINTLKTKLLKMLE